ncbi:minor capsid protein [Tuberibacillus calidus]|jgi:SPP1 gp7 family putative phage head morphogenesis protein|uniref:minor capsid protein n=1 Tax=Tuberibacillus calidus TaxID=340097 RepID=UPI0004131E18|nr:minor capsid protein [Tuberibacillus calidus]
MANNRNTLGYSIVDYRNNVILKQEKAFLTSLTKLYQSSHGKLRTYLAILFEKYGDKDGKLKQEELLKYKRYLTIKKDIQDIIKEQGKEELKLLNHQLNSIVEDEHNYSLFLLFSLGMIKTNQVKPLTSGERNKIMNSIWYGEHFSDTLSKHKGQLANNLYLSIFTSSSTGLTLTDATQITKKKLETGIKNTQRIYQTEQQRKRIDSALLAFNEKGHYSGKYQWLATLDERTCHICREFDGKYYELDKLPKYPSHPYCRCVVLPDLESYGVEPISYRAARDPRTRKTYLTTAKNYREWQIKQGLISS